MKCENCFNCNGFYVLKSGFVDGDPEEGYFTTYSDSEKIPPTKPLNRLYPKGDVGLTAHSLPVFVQCCECGVAPLPEDQPELVKRVLEESIQEQKKAFEWTKQDTKPIATTV